MTHIQTREENAMLTEGNNRWYLVGGLVAAAAVGYWLWQRSKNDDDSGTTGGGGGDGGGGGGGGDDNGGPPPKQVIPQALPGLIPESAWNTTPEGATQFPFVFGKEYVGSVIVPIWASPEYSDNHAVVASGGIADLQVTSIAPVPPPEGAQGSEWVRVSLKFRADDKGTVRLAQWNSDLEVYGPVYGPGGVGPVVRTLLLEEPVAGG